MTDPTPLLGLDRNNTRVALNKLDLMGGLLGSFAPDMDTIVASTRTFGYRGARFRDGLGGVTFEPDGTIVCTDDAISFVQYDAVGGVTIASSLDPEKYAIAEVTCASGAITHIEDLRDLNLHDVPGLYLDDLLDVEIYDPQDLDRLTYDTASGLWINAPDAGASLAVEDEGTTEVSPATILDFRGAGVTVTDQGSGRARVTIPAVSFPSSLLGTPKALFEADHSSIASLTDGDAISQWDDLSGNGNHLTSSSTARPLKQTDADGLEYVQFDGTDDILDVSGMSAYTGESFTVYMVVRAVETGSRGILALWDGTSDDGTTTTGFIFATGASAGVPYKLVRNSVTWDMPRSTLSAVNLRPAMGVWTVAAIRYRHNAPPAAGTLLSMKQNELTGEYIPTFSTHSMSRLLLGARFFSSALSLWTRMDVRAVGVYCEDTPDHVFLNNLRYFGRKWGALVL